MMSDDELRERVRFLHRLEERGGSVYDMHNLPHAPTCRKSVFHMVTLSCGIKDCDVYSVFCCCLPPNRRILTIKCDFCGIRYCYKHAPQYQCFECEGGGCFEHTDDDGVNHTLKKCSTPYCGKITHFGCVEILCDTCLDTSDDIAALCNDCYADKTPIVSCKDTSCNDTTCGRHSVLCALCGGVLCGNCGDNHKRDFWGFGQNVAICGKNFCGDIAGDMDKIEDLDGDDDTDAEAEARRNALLTNPPHWRWNWRYRYADVAVALATLDLPVLLLLMILDETAPPIVAEKTMMLRKWKPLVAVQKAYQKKIAALTEE